MDLRKARAEHSRIMVLASHLGGSARGVRSLTDACEVRTLILLLDDLLQPHLADEDARRYPGLMASPDREVQALAAAAHREVTGLGGVWNGYRVRWTITRILAHSGRFAVATRDILGALSLRIEMENDILYPAMDRVRARAGRTAA